MAHHDQTQHFNGMLEQAQKEHADKRVAMERAVKDANAQLAKEKRDRDIAEARYQQLQARTDVEYTSAHDFMTENPSTE